MVTNKEKTGIQ